MSNWYFSRLEKRNVKDYDVKPILTAIKPETKLAFIDKEKDLVLSTDICNKENILIANKSGNIYVWSYSNILDNYVDYLHYIIQCKPEYPLGYVPTSEETEFHIKHLEEKINYVKPLYKLNIPNLLYCKWLNNSSKITLSDTNNNIYIFDICSSLKTPLLKKKNISDPIRFMINYNDYTTSNMETYNKLDSDVITCFLQNEVKLFDIRIGQFIGTKINTRNPSSAIYSHIKSQYLYIGTFNGEIYAWDLRNTLQPITFSITRKETSQFNGTSNRLNELLSELKAHRESRKIIHEQMYKTDKKPKYYPLKKDNLHNKLGFNSETDMWNFVRTTSDSIPSNTVKKQKVTKKKLIEKSNKNASSLYSSLDSLFYPGADLVQEDYSREDVEMTLPYNEPIVNTSTRKSISSFTKISKSKKLRNYTESSTNVSLGNALENALYRINTNKAQLDDSVVHRYPISSFNFIQNGKYILSSTIASVDPHHIYTGKDHFKVWNPYNGGMGDIIFDIPAYLCKVPTLSEIHSRCIMANKDKFKHHTVYSTRCDVIKGINNVEYLLSGFGNRLLIHDAIDGTLKASPASSHTNQIVAVYCPSKIPDISAGLGSGLLTIDCMGDINCWTTKTHSF